MFCNSYFYSVLIYLNMAEEFDERKWKRDKPVQEYWSEASDAWAEFIRDGKDISREYLNSPGTFELLGNVDGKILLDLGCGEGYNTRLLARKGAKVTGVDFSEAMIKLANEEEEKEQLGIEYRVGDAADLKMLADNTFDIVSCFMVYMDFEDIDGVSKEVARVLKPGGEAIISMPHPCFEMRLENGEKVSGWIYENMDDPDDRGEPLYVKQTNYFQEGAYVLDWKMKRINKHFKTISFRRTLTDYVKVLGKHNLLICDMLEPKPTAEGIEKFPELEKINRVPQSIIFKAKKV